MKVINSYMSVLVAEKSLRERRRLSVRVIVEETKCSRSAVERLLNNTIREVPLDDLAAICVWLSCTPGDILRLEDREDVLSW